MISVIIPAYNEENSIESAIEEIINVLKCNNIYNDAEIIVVNDGSTDNTRNLAIGKGVVVLDNPLNCRIWIFFKKRYTKC